jgi:hypothetical protein
MKPTYLIPSVTVIVCLCVASAATAQLQLLTDPCAESFSGSAPNQILSEWTESPLNASDYYHQQNTVVDHCGSIVSSQQITIDGYLEPMWTAGLYKDFSDLVPGHEYTFSAWFWLKEGSSNDWRLGAGISVQVGTTPPNGTHYWEDASVIPGVSGTVGGTTEHARTNCWSGSGQAACTQDETWFQRVITWTQPAGMTYCRLMIGYDMKFDTTHVALVDDISFTDNDAVVQGPALLYAWSIRTHDIFAPAPAPWWVELPLSGTPAVEPRMSIGDPGIELDFDMAVDAADGVLDCSEVTITNGSCLDVHSYMSGTKLVVDMMFDTNACVTVELNGIVSADTEAPMTGDNDVQVLCRQGNVNGDDDVNVLDLQDIKNRLFEQVWQDNAIYDINCDASINVIDLQETKNNLFTDASCP